MRHSSGRLGARAVCALWLGVTLILYHQVVLTAQTCRGIQSWEWSAYGGHYESDGLIHYRIGFEGSVPQAVQDAVSNAAQQWNSLSQQSGIALDFSPGYPDVRVIMSSHSAQTGGVPASTVTRRASPLTRMSSRHGQAPIKSLQLWCLPMNWGISSAWMKPPRMPKVR